MYHILEIFFTDVHQTCVILDILNATRLEKYVALFMITSSH